MSGQVARVELDKRELRLLIGSLEAGIKTVEEPDERVGMLDPDREPELQEMRDLLEKLYAELAELGRRVPPD